MASYANKAIHRTVGTIGITANRSPYIATIHQLVAHAAPINILTIVFILSPVLDVSRPISLLRVYSHDTHTAQGP